MNLGALFFLISLPQKPVTTKYLQYNCNILNFYITQYYNLLVLHGLQLLIHWCKQRCHWTLMWISLMGMCLLQWVINVICHVINLNSYLELYFSIEIIFQVLQLICVVYQWNCACIRKQKLSIDEHTPLTYFVNRNVLQQDGLAHISGYEREKPTIVDSTKRSLKEFKCTKLVKDAIPVVGWLPKYSIKNDFVGDLMAGVTVAVMHIPQGGTFRSVTY